MATAKPAKATPKQKLIAGVALALMGLLGLFFAFVVSPAISGSTGVADEYVSMMMAAGFFVIAAMGLLLAKSMNKKKATERK
jgi:hypothetical protein